MAQVALGELGVDELFRRPAHHFLLKTGLEFGEQFHIAADVARFQDRGADCHVRLGLADALVDVAGGMAHLVAHVPEEIEHVLDDLLAPRRLLERQNEQQVDIGARRQRAPPISANGRDRQPLAARRVVVVVDVLGGEAVDRFDQRVLQVRQPLGAQRAVAVVQQQRFRLVARLAIDSLEMRKQLRPQGGGSRSMAAVCDEFLDVIQKTGRIDQRLGKGLLRHDGAPLCLRRRICNCPAEPRAVPGESRITPRLSLPWSLLPTLEPPAWGHPSIRPPWPAAGSGCR